MAVSHHWAKKGVHVLLKLYDFGRLMSHVTLILIWEPVTACYHIFLRFFFFFLETSKWKQWVPWLCTPDSLRKRRKALQGLGNIVPENGNLPACANPLRPGKMKSRQILLALFIKFHNRYRPPESQTHSAACHLEGVQYMAGICQRRSPSHSVSLTWGTPRSITTFISCEVLLPTSFSQIFLVKTNLFFLMVKMSKQAQKHFFILDVHLTGTVDQH